MKPVLIGKKATVMLNSMNRQRKQYLRVVVARNGNNEKKKK